jgi:hypothetical protein
MVRYNAFNVDPGKYQQQAMRNFTNAMQTGNQNQQAADRNALYRQQQADLRAQRRTQNAFEAQRVGELQKRTEIDQQRADQQAAANKIRGFATVLSLSQYGKDADEKRKLFISGAKEVGLDDIAEDSPFVPSFNDDGSVSIPVGEGPDGNPLGVFDLKGERENIGKLLEAIKADPAIMQNEVAFASIANDLGVKYEVRKGWSAQPKTEKPSVADRKFEWEKQKEEINNYTDNFIFESLDGVTKNKNGIYGKEEVDIEGNKVFKPLTGDERRVVSYAQKRARAIASRAKAKGISFDEAAYDYEVAMVNAVQREMDATELKYRAPAHVPQSSKKAKKPKVTRPQNRGSFSKEGAENPITQYIMNDLGSSWTFGKSAKEIAEERKKR